MEPTYEPPLTDAQLTAMFRPMLYDGFVQAGAPDPEAATQAAMDAGALDAVRARHDLLNQQSRINPAGTWLHAMRDTVDVLCGL